MNEIYWMDLAALIWFVVLWGGYTFFADRLKGEGRNLLTVMRKHREMWMVRMLHRENRISDTQILSSIMRSVGLFSTTTLFILAGLLAILGAVDKAQNVIGTLPFMDAGTQMQWELKTLVLLLIFIYAFF